MNYHLSTKAILSTLHAMAALQAMACGEDERALLAPILCRERTGLLTEIIKNAFAEVVLKLGPLVADMDMGEEADNITDCLMSVELVTPAGFSSSRNTIMRRALEQTVALTALHMWCRVSQTGQAAGKVSAALADSFATVAAEWYHTLTSFLAPPLYPAIRK